MQGLSLCKVSLFALIFLGNAHTHTCRKIWPVGGVKNISSSLDETHEYIRSL